MAKQRRTPTLTRMCRELFEEYIFSDGWIPGETIPRIARELGLEDNQVRDAIFAPAADKWRHQLYADRRNPNALR